MSRESRQLCCTPQPTPDVDKFLQCSTVYEHLRLPSKFRSLLNTEFWHVKARLSTALHPFTITMNSHRYIKTVYMEDRLLKDLGTLVSNTLIHWATSRYLLPNDALSYSYPFFMSVGTCSSRDIDHRSLPMARIGRFTELCEEYLRRLFEWLLQWRRVYPLLCWLCRLDMRMRSILCSDLSCFLCGCHRM